VLLLILTLALDSAHPDVFNVLLPQVENRILDVLLAILCLPQSDRMRVCS
jgi:hypothetical protein